MKGAVLGSALRSIANRGSAAVVLFVGLREASLALDAENVALYVVASYAPALLTLFDLGASNAMISPLTHASTDNDTARARRLLATALRRVLVGTALGAVFVALLAPQFLQAGGGAGPAWTGVLLMVLVLVLTTANQALAAAAQALFEFGRYASLATLGNLLAVALLAGGAAQALGPSWMTYVALSVLPAQLLALAVVPRLRNRLAATRPAGAVRDRPDETSAEMHRSAWIFLVLQAAGAVLAAADPFLLKSFAHPAQAAVLGIATRLTQLLSTPLLLVAAQLWPVYARLRAQGNSEALRRLLRLSMLAGAALALLGAPLLIFGGPTLLHLIAPRFEQQHPGAWTSALGLGAAAYLGANIVLAPLAAFMNGTGLLRPQLVASVAFIALVLPLKAWFAFTGSAVAMLLASAVMLLILNFASLFWLHRDSYSEAIGRP